MTGEELYAIVEAYAGFGEHHTGTPADTRTTAWLAEHLESLGATVEVTPFDFPRWSGTSELTLDNGSPVPQLPVFYSRTGHLVTGDLDVVDITAEMTTGGGALDSLLAEPLAPDGATSNRATSNSAVVLVTHGPPDLPVQCNRSPVPRSGRAAVIVSKNWADRVRSGATLRFEAAMEDGRSSNLEATMGPENAPPVTVTTPLSGWTPAAGERGTGLAAALAIAQDLAVDHRIRFVACSGHELDHAGLRHWLAAALPTGITGQPVIHLGASVGAIGADGQLGHSRRVLTTAAGPRRADVTSIVGAANWTTMDGDWIGEGATWHAAGASVLSFLGHSRYFHTAGDVPDAATHPEAMALATSTALAATRRFLARDEG